MFAWFQKIDAWLIEQIFEPIAWRAEYYWGWNNFWCARAVLLVYLVAWVAFTPWTGWGVASLPIPFIYSGLFYWGTVRREQEQKRGFINPERAPWPTLFRLIGFLGLATVILVSVISRDPSATPLMFLLIDIAVMGYISYLYFIACSRMPPKWQVQKEMHRHFKMMRLAVSKGRILSS